MKNHFQPIALALACLLFSGAAVAQEDEERIAFLADSLDADVSDIRAYIDFKKYSDSLESTFHYVYDEAPLHGEMARIKIPKGYKYLDKKEANRVLSDLWGNPEDPSLLGLLLREDESPVETTYGIEITYSDEGYIEDDDAEDIDYDDLLEQMQTDARNANPERKRLGYPEVALIGWAAEPYYDKTHKKLHWAKELAFEGEEEHTLNYNIRVLGRNGYMNLNVIGSMDVLENVQENLDPILASVTFNEGFRYEDFDPALDDVAAYGIGGLIAGKILAKAGFFAFLAKFWKILAVGGLALVGGLRKRIFGSKT